MVSKPADSQSPYRVRPRYTYPPMNTDYTPIDCYFYNVLEAAATQRRRVELQYFNDLRQLCLGAGVIDTFFIRDKVEFLQLKSG